jgi:hypothetical protein
MKWQYPQKWILVRFSEGPACFISVPGAAQSREFAAFGSRMTIIRFPVLPVLLPRLSQKGTP